ncbi:WD repeat-containing protein 81 [Venturia canescens]|uniref:WD repeat-containing protein 81 n=1 Tax=Venturia canescens TaxID=32260 RepID=UPI001C9C4C40|nr:WD repeat-containing protein 81 [Venturia canescens]
MEILNAQFGIPTKYMELSDGKICATVHKNWLANLWTIGPIQFLIHERLSMDEIAARPSLEDLGPNWTRIYIRVYEKQNKNAIPLPRDRHSTSAKVQPELTFAQLLRYVAETNYRNLWKESYKKHYSLWNSWELKEQSHALPSSSDVAVMREILARMYGCSLIKIRNGHVIGVNPRATSTSHCNLLPALLAVETSLAFMVFHEQTARYSLQECVMYSPAALSTSYSKPLFLIYQLLCLSRDLYDQGLALGEITLGDILIMDNFTIQVMPKLSDNIYLKSEFDNDQQTTRENQSSPSQQKKIGSPSKLGVTTGNPEFGRNESIAKVCELWLHGHISNFDYLTALNNLAGRRYGDPSCHHVMPWVTDFSSRCGRNWRDLTKSKFRLNKGDRQLDLTFDSQTIDVGHHVSDVLSEITYYVYLSRRYTKSVLCKHVRSHWVPWEYPVSIQRLHEWSPDECIPQFFTDPSVFKSIHEDLPNLEIPSWARSPEDFIEKHREALESLYVSERLHHWIDLTFGYKLSGIAAIKSKNVCLQLVDNHTSLTSSGVVQLFTQPHPQKIVPSLYWSKMPPRLRNSASNPKIARSERSGEKISEDEGHSSGMDEEESPITTLNVARSSPLALSRLLSRSRGSLLSVDENSSKAEKPTAQMIILPKDYNPVAAIVQVETTHAFMNRVSHRTYKPEISHHGGIANYKQIVASGRMKEQQIIGCLIVEIFLANKFRATWNTGRVSFANRLETCLNVLKTSSEPLPKCVRNAVALLLQIDIMPKSYGIFNELGEAMRAGSIGNFRYPMVTCMGLPPPSAHQFLQPVLSGSLYPSSKYFQCLFNLVEMLQEYNELVRELNYVLQDEEGGDSNTTRTKIRYLCKISECKVKSVARELEKLLPQAGANAMEMSLQLIVPHVQQIMNEPYSAVLAAWYLFDPIAKALGPRETCDTFLSSILRLYENGSVMDSLNITDVLPAGSLAKFRTMRLYHRSFLLKLMVRLGLRRFLDNFVTPLVEAVGGYRDYIQGSCSSNLPRSGNLKSCDLSGNSGDGEVILSPLDEDSSLDSDNNATSLCEQAADEFSKTTTPIVLDTDIEEVFTMETESSPSPSENNRIPSIDIRAELSLNLVEDLCEEGVRNSPPGSIKSPTIPIPRRSDGGATKSVTDFNSIGCHVGSKTSSEDMPLGGSYVTGKSHGYNTNDFDEVEVQKRLIIRDDEAKSGIDEVISPMETRTYGPCECKVSEMSAESVIWLSHRLGPVLTARHLSRNLLRMLTLCYAGKSNLSGHQDENGDWNDNTLAGDLNAVKVLECLTAIAGLYGEQIILLQYLAHMTELLSLCKRKLTPNLEGGLVSSLALLVHIAPCLSDSFLMEALQETIVKSILHPTVRVLSTTRYNFPNGSIARSALAEKYLDAIFTLSSRLGASMTKSHLAVPIQRFFLAFDKAFAPVAKNDEKSSLSGSCNKSDRKNDASSDENQRHDDWTLIDNSGIQLLSSANNDVSISYSPPVLENDDVPNTTRNKAFEELREVFTKRFAHRAYLLFYRHINEETMEEILKNHRLVRDLCHEYEAETRLNESEDYSKANNLSTREDELEESETFSKGIGSFGNISVVGNRIEVQTESVGSRTQGGVPEDEERISSRDNGGSSNGRQLRGNWLAYWEHEIGRPDKDTNFNLKQIKLQNFVGHTNSIRCIYVLDNENSFMSGARDKTVKLWSLRSQGDGNTSSSCQYTYTGHKKSILALTFLESLRYAVTCDSTVHCWDPFMGSLLGCPESTRPAPVNTLAASPAPSTSLLVATTDITIRVIDCRTFQYVNEMKVSMNPTGLIRCIAIAPSGYWVALGQASGFLTILDIRTGLIIASWKGHECEILQLEAVNETTIVSSSLDQTIAVWSAVDGKLKFHLKGATEPVHCMAIYEQQLVSATTANRIGVYTAVDANSSFVSSKLRSDAFRGVITAMAVLPLNRLLLLGADNGGITLLC